MGKELPGDKDMVGRTVSWWDWNDAGEDVVYRGVVEEAFREPPEEDRYERLNYRVRLENGSRRTPYAVDCRAE